MKLRRKYFDQRTPSYNILVGDFGNRQTDVFKLAIQRRQNP